MLRYRLQRILREARLSGFEEGSLAAGVLAIAVAIGAALPSDEPGGFSRNLGSIGLGALAAYAISRGIRLYRAGISGSLPRTVGKLRIRRGPSRALTAATVTGALVLPTAVSVALLALDDRAWLAITGVLTVAAFGLLTKRLRTAERAYADPPPAPTELLERLCMRADLPVPALVVKPGPRANAWTSGGRIHLTKPLLELLDESEVEAVLAHELAHIANRDAPVMDICSAPSRVLLGFAGYVAPRVTSCIKHLNRLSVVVVFLAVLSVPPAFVLGWMSRLSVLVMSRSREFAADTAAAALTGRPSALVSALLKLDGADEWPTRADLREVDGLAVLCIVGPGSRLGRFFRTHPPTPARVKRLERLEEQLQASGWVAPGLFAGDRDAADRDQQPAR
jgi:heat shock protein HtpX